MDMKIQSARNLGILVTRSLGSSNESDIAAAGDMFGLVFQVIHAALRLHEGRINDEIMDALEEAIYSIDVCSKSGEKPALAFLPDPDGD
jgi:hypothetical protein